MTESNRIEYKRQLTDNLEKEVVAFLNYHDGGVIYLGIDANGNSVGLDNCDAVQLAVKDRLKNNIQPSIMGLFDIIHEDHDGKDIVRITIAGGLEKPYYLKKYGMTEKGCFIRVGSAAEPMPQEMIESLYGRRVRNTIGRMESTRLDLTFEQLKIYYEARNLHLNSSFMQNLELLTPEGKPNYAAYLLADENGVSIQVAKYADTTRVELIENREYGHCSLVKALKSVLERMNVENTIYTKIGYPLREEREMIHGRAMREAVINAIVHNDYSNGSCPKFEFFSDRLEITSAGGLPYGVSEEDFFNGYSSPRNKEIMRVFRDLEIVEHLGSGVPRILDHYDRRVFQLDPNFLRVVFPYIHSLNDQVENTVSGKTSGKTSGKILEMMRENDRITIPEIADALGKTTRSIEMQINKLKGEGLLCRVGPAKGGYWEVRDD
jgi:predicted HTH transcriptional regulator